MDVSEKYFETTVEGYLVVGDYIKCDSKKNYDRTRCLESEILFGFIFATQPKQ